MTNEEIKLINEESSKIVLNEKPRYYLYDGVRYKSVTEILKERGLINYPNMDMSKYLIRGQNVHTILHWDFEGTLNLETIHSDYLGYYNAYMAFKERFVSQCLFSELKVHVKGAEVCGTLDRIARLKDGRVALIDWKTGQVVDWTKYQLGALANGFKVMTNKLNIDFDIDVVMAVGLKDGYTVYQSESFIDLAFDFALIARGQEPTYDHRLEKLHIPQNVKELDEFTMTNLEVQVNRYAQIIEYEKELDGVKENIRFLMEGRAGVYEVAGHSITMQEKKRNNNAYTEMRIKKIGG